MTTVAVNAAALKQVLQALVGPGHLIRELQVIRGLPVLGGVEYDPITVLITEYNAWAEAEDDDKNTD